MTSTSGPLRARQAAASARKDPKFIDAAALISKIRNVPVRPRDCRSVTPIQVLQNGRNAMAQTFISGMNQDFVPMQCKAKPGV